MSNLEDEIADAMAKEISAEIDFEVISSIMIKQGWHKVVLPRFQSNKHAVDIYNWVESNAKDHFLRHGTSYVFKQEGDAVNFSLRWA